MVRGCRVHRARDRDSRRRIGRCGTVGKVEGAQARTRLHRCGLLVLVRRRRQLRGVEGPHHGLLGDDDLRRGRCAHARPARHHPVAQRLPRRVRLLRPRDRRGHDGHRWLRGRHVLHRGRQLGREERRHHGLRPRGRLEGLRRGRRRQLRAAHHHPVPPVRDPRRALRRGERSVRLRRRRPRVKLVARRLRLGGGEGPRSRATTSRRASTSGPAIPSPASAWPWFSCAPSRWGS